MFLDYNFRNYNYRLFLYVLLLNITGVEASFVFTVVKGAPPTRISPWS